MRELFRYMLPDDIQYEAFITWAFHGETPGTNPMGWLKKWNRIHGKQMLLSHEGDICEDVARMVDLWKYTLLETHDDR